jgi:hypothetical protein
LAFTGSSPRLDGSAPGRPRDDAEGRDRSEGRRDSTRAAVEMRRIREPDDLLVRRGWHRIDEFEIDL